MRCCVRWSLLRMPLCAADECCICYDSGPQVRMLTCNHSICTDCCHKIRSTSCPMCRKAGASAENRALNTGQNQTRFPNPPPSAQDIEDALLLELRIVRIRRLGAYSFYMALPLMGRDEGSDFFSTDHYPAGFSCLDGDAVFV